MTATWIDRAISVLSPQTALRRMRARAAFEIMRRHYEGAAVGRRTQGWNRHSSDANAATGPYVGRLRDVARDLVRNNPYAASALNTIVNQTVGWGLVAKPATPNPRAKAAWDAWANTTACDADGRSDFAGLQKIVTRAMAQDGEVLVRRRIRRPEDGLPIPLQIQVLEADFLDTSKHGITLPNGGRIVYGIEFDPIGRRAAYWLFPTHPGSDAWTTTASVRIPAEGVLHIYELNRPGAARGASWFGPIVLRMKDFDDFEDATLMKQKIAACLAVITSDVDGSAPPLGAADDTTSPGVDTLSPGSIINATPGRSVTVVDPPTVGEYADYTAASLRSQAAGIGVAYEDFAGDYTDLPFSAAKMSRERIWSHIEDRRWRTLVPLFCDPVWAWAMELAGVMGLTGDQVPVARWTAQPKPMIEPDKEGLAYQRNIRTGLMSLTEALRELGYDPDEVFAEMADVNALLDRLGLRLDSDGRYMTQAGQLQGTALATATPAQAPPTETPRAWGGRR